MTSRIAVCLALLSLTACATLPPPASADLIIRNGRIVDGTGNSWYRGDVAVRGGKIVAVGALPNMTAARVIDAKDHIVAPGFIVGSPGTELEFAL